MLSKIEIGYLIEMIYKFISSDIKKNRIALEPLLKKLQKMETYKLDEDEKEVREVQEESVHTNNNGDDDNEPEPGQLPPED